MESKDFIESKDSFSLLQFNLLADCNVLPSYYPDVNEDLLSLSFRSPKIVNLFLNYLIKILIYKTYVMKTAYNIMYNIVK